MNLYELNQAGYASLPIMTKEQIEKSCQEIIQYLTTFDGKYYMLLNNENKYYTIFTYRGSHKYTTLAKEIVSIASDIGELKAIERNGTVMEFWIQDEDGCHMYVLFNYDLGVIEV